MGGGESAADRISFLLSLRAVRKFREDPVPQEVVDDVLEVARLSGSASNKQPWELVVVRDRATLGALADVEGYADHLAGAALGIVPVMAGGREEQEAYDEGRLCARGSCSPPGRTAWVPASGGSSGAVCRRSRSFSVFRKRGG